MKFGTLILFALLNPDLPRARSNSQWGCHIGQCKMAAIKKLILHYIPNIEKKKKKIYLTASKYNAFLSPALHVFLWVQRLLKNYWSIFLKF